MALPDFKQHEDDYWSRWISYDQQEVRRIINKKRPLMNAAIFHPDEKAVVGVFSVPQRKRKRFRSVTEVHYHNSCNELAILLWGILADKRDSAVSDYITPEEFPVARDEYRFHKANIQELDLPRYHKPDSYFTISMRLLKVKGINGLVVAQFRVYDTVRGKLLYSYVPRASQ
ncbi:MAG: hypothetical protein HY515_03450 [Candidatus Aenigmarchaeota archaeon]|nr:hypothetical protein [Candidatus Aenigmarchaeota archaeon]